MTDHVRTYKVLTEVDLLGEEALGPWRLVGEYEAAEPRAAIRQAIKEHGFANYVAVAEGSWHAESPRPSPEPTIRWS